MTHAHPGDRHPPLQKDARPNGLLGVERDVAWFRSAKIAVPQVPPELVVRAGLRADLDTASRADATLVCAPPGYGKTMLLADWAHTSTGSDTAWVSLDRDDNDPQRLWTSVVAALAACPSVPPDSRLHAPWTWRPSTQPEFLAELTDTVQQLPRPVRLILDDVHELLDPVALHGLHTLLRNRPTGLQLVLSSRFDPPLSLPRLRLTGRLYELRADRLRFSPTETATLLERSGLNLTPTQVDTLHQRTGGWAAGLRLAALALTQTTDRDTFLDQFSGNDSSVADYLTGEILSALPDDTQEFLRVISISDPVPVRAGRQADRPGRRRQPARPPRPPHLATDRHRTTPRRLPHPGTPAHLPDRRPAPPRTHPGRRPAHHRRPLVGRPGPADQRPGPRHPQPQPRTADRAAAPLRHTPDPHRRPRTTTPRARRPRRPSHRVRPLAGPDLRPDPARGRRPARSPGRPAARTAVLAQPRHRRPGRPAHGRRAAGRPDPETLTHRRRPTSTRRPTNQRGDRHQRGDRPRRTVGRTAVGGTHPPGPGHRAARTRRPGRGPHRTRRRTGPGPPPRLPLPDHAMPGAARRHRPHLRRGPHHAGAQHRGDLLRHPTRLASTPPGQPPPPR